MDVLDTALGPEGKLNIQIVDGKIHMTVAHVHASGTINISISEDVKYFLELLKAQIPNAIVGAGIEMVEKVLP